MSKNINKNYDIPNKIKNNWEDVSKLIALENQLIEKIKYLEDKVNRLWQNVNNAKKDN